MIDIYVLNKDLEQIGIIDQYTSLLWVPRYDKEGDCELYIEATNANRELLKRGNYLSRLDDEMVCRIETSELDTDVEDGDYLIVKGFDVKKILAQRIIWTQASVDGNVEDYIRDMVYKSLVNPALSARQIKNESGRPNFFLGTKAGFKQITTEQATYKKVNEKVQELCKKYGWGYKVIVDIGNFYFVLYKGTDRSENVIFSEDYENLRSTKYKEDSSNLANVALIGGEGEGSKRSRNVSGYAEGLNRNEIFVDAKDISRTISWESLKRMYPTTDNGGQGYVTESLLGAAVYKMNYIDIAIVDANQLSELKNSYPDGNEQTIDGNLYYRVYDAVIADLPSTALTTPLQNTDNVILRDLVYSVYLLNRGYEKLSEYGSVISFEGSIEPDITFKYKRDYFLGDKVTVENEYGIKATARIVEVMEVCDDNGYSVEPKFEYIEAEETTETASYLLDETGEKLTTENDEFIELEDTTFPTMKSMARNVVGSSGSKKISELNEITEIYDGCCMPIVSMGETKKVTYSFLKDKIGTKSLTNIEIENLLK